MLIYFEAVYQTIASMGPHYLVSIYNWVKTAVWEAPYRFILDVELEKIRLERNLSLRDYDEIYSEECKNSWFRYEPTNSVLLFAKWPNPFVRIFNALFGTRFFIVPSQSKRPLDPKSDLCTIYMNHFSTLMEIIDRNTEHIPEGDYLQFCTVISDLRRQYMDSTHLEYEPVIPSVYVPQAPPYFPPDDMDWYPSA